VRPAVRRVLELLGLDLERRPSGAGQAREHVRGNGGQGPDHLVRQLQVARVRAQQVMAEARMLAGIVAATEDRLAVTFARLAERRPDSAERLRQLSEDARGEAMHLRDRAQASGTRVARRAGAGDRDTGAEPVAGPVRATVTAAEAGPVVVLSLLGADHLVAMAGQAAGDAAAPATRGVVSVDETRNCQQCRAVFIPRREHARFCSSSCRDSWNLERGGDMRTGASALSWTVTAMRDVTGSLAAAGAQDRPHAFEAISEAVWWVTIVDATLNRHHLSACENVIQAQPAPDRELIEGTLSGLRFVRNQMGYHVQPADFIEPTQSHLSCADGPVTAWLWRSLPEPALAWLPPGGRAWEMTRYQGYEGQLAGHSIGETFGRAAAFLKLASASAIRHPLRSGQLQHAGRVVRGGRADVVVVDAWLTAKDHAIQRVRIVTPPWARPPRSAPPGSSSCARSARRTSGAAWGRPLARSRAVW